MYQVILYYKFTRIENPESFLEHHRKSCELFGLQGRVYIAEEGINGTLAGETQDIYDYMAFVRALPGFEDTQFKIDDSAEMPFRRLVIKIRPEIVTLKAEDDVNPAETHGRYLSPQEWKQALDSEKDITLIDVRNNYESAIGHFEGAICPDVENFFDFPKWLENANLDKNKKVLMYCTGGIRCEKFSLLMEKKGFKDVLQLHGGIINYAQEIGDAHYKGKCFVFDDRLIVPVEKNQKEPLSRCEITGTPCDSYINCSNPDCNKLFICSPEGVAKYQGCCSEACYNAPRRRPLNQANIYAPSLRWHQYSEDGREPLLSSGQSRQEIDGNKAKY